MDRIWTGVHGFADHCLATRPPHHILNSTFHMNWQISISFERIENIILIYSLSNQNLKKIRKNFIIPESGISFLYIIYIENIFADIFHWKSGSADQNKKWLNHFIINNHTRRQYFRFVNRSQIIRSKREFLKYQILLQYRFILPWLIYDFTMLSSLCRSILCTRY